METRNSMGDRPFTEQDIHREARRQYLRYFRFWFIAAGILALACILLKIRQMAAEVPRTNHEAPAERVYDYADVLTDSEEADLRKYITEMEKRYHIDIVLVIISQSVEGQEAMERYGLRSADWEQNMQDLADDFWDENKFGYNKGFEGDGVLLLHNWYEGQNGEHLSTSGSVERRFSLNDIDQVLYAVDDYYATDPHRAYRAYVREVCERMDTSLSLPFSWGFVIVLPVIVTLIYAVSGASQKKAENTVAVNAYVADGRPQIRGREDALLRKNVVARKIETDSGSSRGGGGGGGGGGHHTSSGGASHGGGSHRH
ncbi:MAG: TPM domain-containing protein [Lachnospiraceae bacterium]|nr:TPM domain-containing protein [Lachnospiraceae bacterium]